MRTRTSFAAVLALGLAVTGCYGPFRLTKRLHSWNGQVGEKWVNEAAFVALVIVPVYGFAALADAIVFNSIEFWTGSNPMASGPKSIRQDTREAVLRYDAERRRLRVDSFERGRIVSTVILEPDAAGGMAARDAKGRLLARAVETNGVVRVTDAAGKELASGTPEELSLR